MGKVYTSAELKSIRIAVPMVLGELRFGNITRISFGMDGDSCVECHMLGSYLCGCARLGDIHLIIIKDRVDVSSFQAQLIVQPLDRCVWQRLSISPTS